MLLPVAIFTVAGCTTCLLVQHAGARLLLLVLLTLATFTWWAMRLTHRADAISDRMRRLGRRGALAFLLTALGACRPQPALAPEPADIMALDCGARTCSISQAAGVAVVWVSE